MFLSACTSLFRAPTPLSRPLDTPPETPLSGLALRAHLAARSALRSGARIGSTVDGLPIVIIGRLRIKDDATRDHDSSSPLLDEELCYPVTVAACNWVDRNIGHSNKIIQLELCYYARVDI
ncbi:MAG TPA: hypothetical protein VFB12_18320 [Ktedonobacteraceae bacterium]|nr:hypothetical protein [Ktedonobacteraceae bacterium]